jgi:hypothetical protein
MAESWNTFEAEYWRHIQSVRKPSLLARIGLSNRIERGRYDDGRIAVVDRSRARWATGSEFRSVLLLMLEFQSFLTTVLAEAARSRGGDMDERDLIVWSLGRMGNNVLHSIRHAFLDTVFPSVASGIRSLLEVIATIEYVKASDENLNAYLRSEDEGAQPLRIGFQGLLRTIDARDDLNLLELYGHYSELTHPKLSIVKTALVTFPNSSNVYLALDDEWASDALRQHWLVAQLCVDQIAVRVMGHFGMDRVLIQRLEQLANDPDPFKDVIE